GEPPPGRPSAGHAAEPRGSEAGAGPVRVGRRRRRQPARLRGRAGTVGTGAQEGAPGMTHTAYCIAHIRRLQAALVELEPSVPRLCSWSCRLGTVLDRGGRLLTVGNGGSAAEAQHLAAE